MNTEQIMFTKEQNKEETTLEFALKPDLIFVFASALFFNEPVLLNKLTAHYPDAEIVGCSTEGQVLKNSVLREELVLTAVEFRSTKVVSHTVEVLSTKNHYEKGLELASLFKKEGLKHVFLLSVSLATYGDDFIKGLRKGFPQEVKVTGGLAGDNKKYNKDFVLDGSREPNSTVAKAIGFYGDSLTITYASVGGWEEKPIKLKATQSSKNVLETINNKPALDVYREVLMLSEDEVGESSIKYPFSVYQVGENEPVIRAVVGVDTKNKTITFGGNIEEGSTLKIMKASVDRIIEGAGEAATKGLSAIPQSHQVKLALIVSCNSRKTFLNDYVSEEIEQVIDEVGQHTTYTGFYARGEIAPFKQDENVRLHNQTMTLTLFSEEDLSSKKHKDSKQKQNLFKRLFG